MWYTGFMASPFVLEDPDKWQEYLGAIRVGQGKHKAAARVGTTARKVSAWLKTRPEQQEDLTDAEDAATELVEERLYEAALAGEPWAVSQWVRNRAPERWKAEQKANGLNVGTINVLSGVDPEQLSNMMRELKETTTPPAIETTAVETF